MADISEQWAGGGDGTNYSGRHQHPVKLKQDKRLREWCFGSLEGISNRDFTQKIRQELETEIGMKELNQRLQEIPDILVWADESGWLESFECIGTRLKSARQAL